jgi:hypothetical protein
MQTDYFIAKWAISHWTDAAIFEGNFALVKQHFSFMDIALSRATDELENLGNELGSARIILLQNL